MVNHLTAKKWNHSTLNCPFSTIPKPEWSEFHNFAAILSNNYFIFDDFVYYFVEFYYFIMTGFSNGVFPKNIVSKQPPPRGEGSVDGAWGT